MISLGVSRIDHTMLHVTVLFYCFYPCWLFEFISWPWKFTLQIRARNRFCYSTVIVCVFFLGGGGGLVHGHQKNVYWPTYIVVYYLIFYSRLLMSSRIIQTMLTTSLLHVSCTMFFSAIFQHFQQFLILSYLYSSVWRIRGQRHKGLGRLQERGHGEG